MMAFKAPPHPSIAPAFDALRMIKQAAERGGDTRVELEDALNSIEYFVKYARNVLHPQKPAQEQKPCTDQ